MSPIVGALFSVGIAFCQTAPSPREPGTGCPVQAQPGRRIINGNIPPPKLISDPKPEIPPLARAARVRGRVVMSAVIDTEGHVASLHVLAGHPLLISAAMDAAKQYRYEPPMVQCMPISMMLTIEVRFKTELDPVNPIPIQ